MAGKDYSGTPLAEARREARLRRRRLLHDSQRPRAPLRRVEGDDAADELWVAWPRRRRRSRAISPSMQFRRSASGTASSTTSRARSSPAVWRATGEPNQRKSADLRCLVACAAHAPESGGGKNSASVSGSSSSTGSPNPRPLSSSIRPSAPSVTASRVERPSTRRGHPRPRPLARGGRQRPHE
jgi:hypothetical protein